MKVDALFADADFIAQVQRIFRAHADNHFPALRGQVDDLTNQSLVDLWRYLQRTPTLAQELEPAVGHTLSGAAWDAIARIAISILKRRAADIYRKTAGKWAEQTLPNAGTSESSIANGAPSASRHVLLRQMLQVCMAELARASPEDREVIWMVIGIADADSAVMSDAERQRLSRLRKRIAAAIQRELGESAKALLAADLQDE